MAIDEIVELARAHGFQVETHNGWQRMFSLNDGEIALVCNRCGEVIETSLSRPDLTSWISSLECPAKDKCYLENDERLLTQTGVMQWCKDYYGFAGFLVHAINSSITEGSPAAFISEIENIDTAYFAVDSQCHNPNEAYLFIICFTHERKEYALLKLENITIKEGYLSGQFHMHNLWTEFEEVLESLIEKQICSPTRTSSAANATALEATLDYYLYLARELISYTRDIWKNPAKDDVHLSRYIKSHTCPVCRWPYTAKEKACSNCGFNDIHKVFINIEDGQYWKTHAVAQYQTDFFYRNFEVVDGTVIRKTSAEGFYTIIIPEFVKSLGEKAFGEIKKLRYVLCPDSLREIGKEAFDGCYNLKHIILPPLLRFIGARAFNHTDINYIDLPSSLEVIEEEAFWCCHLLEEIVIPLSVRSMGYNVFGGCGKLKHIYCEAAKQPLDWDEKWVKQHNRFLDCPAKVHWGNSWHYDEHGKPVLN